MAKFTVDGPNLLLIAKAGVVDVDVQVDLYSDAKEHWLTTTDNKFNFPFRTVAGDPIAAGKLFGDGYFLTNGWKIRPDEVDHELLIDGNLFLDEGETPGLFVPTVGGFTVLAILERSTDPRQVLVAADAPDEAHLSVAYDGTTIQLGVWLDRLGATVLSPTSCTVDWYVAATDTLLFSVSDSSPDARGHFDFTRVETLIANESYYCDVSVTDAQGTKTTRRGVPTVGP